MLRGERARYGAQLMDHLGERLAGEFGRLPILGGGMTQLVVFRAVQGLGAVGWVLAGWLIVGVLVGALIVGHYLMTAERVRWLLDQR